MAQLFSPAADRRFRLILIVGALLLALLIATAFAMARSGTAWHVGRPAPQPIPFSHAIHAGGLDLDCRYCHAVVQRAASAGMPSAELCLGCHERVWNVAAQFAPLRSALALDAPVIWSSVHRLPEHARFHHGAHIQAGVGCATCHGQVETMPRTVKAETLHMGWCLDCHRQAARGEVPGIAPTGLAAQRYVHLGLEVPPMTRCTVCHR
ncbi:MAG TPA: cytochrome c3 family protein [Acetobacteraceae bacterium]|nr:cytochrome c3 family protein [Acetobacteraceae bacterium]